MLGFLFFFLSTMTPFSLRKLQSHPQHYILSFWWSFFPVIHSSAIISILSTPSPPMVVFSMHFFFLFNISPFDQLFYHQQLPFCEVVLFLTCFLLHWMPLFFIVSCSCLWLVFSWLTLTRVLIAIVGFHLVEILVQPHQEAPAPAPILHLDSLDFVSNSPYLVRANPRNCLR